MTSDGVKSMTYEPPYNDRNYALFDVLALQGRGRAGISESIVPTRGVFPDAPKTKELEDEYEWCYGFTYFDWCEISALANTPAAEIVDWYRVDEMDEDIDEKDYPRYNPLRFWLQDIDFVLTCYGVYFPKPGDIIVQVGFDC